MNAACRLCGAPALVRLFEKDGWPITRCTQCTLVQVAAQLTRSELAQLYGESYYADGVFENYAAEREARRASGLHHARTLASVVGGGRLLDVGCAAGFFLDAAGELFEPTGVEMSASAAQSARDELGLRVFTGDVVDGMLEGERFDVVTLWNTVEHMADPAGALNAVAALMNPGSLLALSTGDVTGPLARRDLRNWTLMAPPHHLSYFSPATIERLLAGAGFVLGKIVYDGVVTSGGPLTSRPARDAATVLGLGNVMTIYALRTPAPRPPSRRHRVVARYRPLGHLRRERATLRDLAAR